MAELVLATTYVLGGEFAIGLSEMHKQIPSKPGIRRYQIIKVVRGDKEAVYTEDMGDAKKFRGIDQFYIPSYMVHTVDELREMADDMRGSPPVDILELIRLDRINV